MQRFLFTFEVRPGREADYDRLHRDVWPELLDVLRASGVANYTLFRRGTTVFGYAECEPDAATAFGRVAATDVSARWAASLEGVVVTPYRDGGVLESADEVWHLD